MENKNSKPLSSLIFIPLLSLLFIRPFVSGLSYPVFEFYYEITIITIAIITIMPLIKLHKLPSATCAVKYGWILLLSAAYLISTITSINIQNSIKETLKFASYIAIFFTVLQADANQKKSIIKTIVIASLIISVYSIYQYIWGYSYTIEYAKKINSSLLNPPHNIYAKNILINKRAIGTFPSPNILGGYLLMAFFLALAILKNQVSHKRWLFAPPLIIIALMLTKSLGAWISFIAIFIILFFTSYNAIKKHKVLLIISFACITLTMLFIILGRWDRITDLGSHHNSISMRFNYWKTAMAIIKDHPFIGIGPGNFQQIFLKYYTLGWGTGTKYAHNVFLQLWLETGILGFISMLYLTIAFITKNALKSSYVFLAALTFFLHNLIDITYFIPETGLIWWAIMGLLF